LIAAESELGPNRQWQAVTETGETFFENIFPNTRDEVASIPEIESIASRSHVIINKFLAERGFNIKLDPFDPREFGAAGILDVLIEWETVGTERALTAESGKTYPGVQMSSKVVDLYQVGPARYPVVHIPTKSGDDVFLMKDDGLKEAVMDNLRLAGQHIVSSAADKVSPTERYAGVHFPMVDLDVQEDISWLIGSSTQGDDGLPGIISQALQQTKFAMDHIGAEVKSAAAIGVMRGGPGPNIYRIDGPFFVVVKRRSLTEPFFVGYITEEFWKQPARSEK
jgi:hypothetical protein